MANLTKKQLEDLLKPTGTGMLGVNLLNNANKSNPVPVPTPTPTVTPTPLPYNSPKPVPTPTPTATPEAEPTLSNAFDDTAWKKITGTGIYDSKLNTLEGAKDIAEVSPVFEEKEKMGYSQPTIGTPTVDAAMDYIEGQLKSFDPQRGNKIDSLINEYVNRADFKYDPNADMLYQNYLAAMQNAGQMAMRDTMGQAAMLTGGYGSSYATAAANGAYNNYLQKANEALPDYYNMAANAYNQQGEDLLSQIKLLQNQDEEEYSRWLDMMKLNGTGTSASTEEAWTPSQENKTRQEALSIYKERGEKGLFEYLDSLSGYNLSDETIEGIMNFVEQYGQNDWEMTKDAWGLFPVARNQYTDSEGNTKTYAELEQEHKEGKISDEEWDLIKSLTKKGQTTKDRR